MLLSKKDLIEYELNGDLIKDLLDKSGEVYTSHRWLLSSIVKRMIYNILYGDLIFNSTNKTVLDVGGGFCSISRILINRHNYSLLDILAHENHNLIKEEEVYLNKKFLIDKDWYAFIPEKYDIVIANDIFPNVDQRLELFINKYLPVTKELRILLTYYNEPRFYFTKRIDADEIFCQLSYSGEQIKNVLDRHIEGNFDILLENHSSLFDNNRQIFILIVRN